MEYTQLRFHQPSLWFRVGSQNSWLGAGPFTSISSPSLQSGFRDKHSLYLPVTLRVLSRQSVAGTAGPVGSLSISMWATD